MADITAQASGPSSAGATWIGGVPPGTGDKALLAGFIITQDTASHRLYQLECQGGEWILDAAGNGFDTYLEWDDTLNSGLIVDDTGKITGLNSAFYGGMKTYGVAFGSEPLTAYWLADSKLDYEMTHFRIHHHKMLYMRETASFDDGYMSDTSKNASHHTTRIYNTNAKMIKFKNITFNNGGGASSLANAVNGLTWSADKFYNLIFTNVPAGALDISTSTSRPFYLQDSYFDPENCQPGLTSQIVCDGINGDANIFVIILRSAGSYTEGTFTYHPAVDQEVELYVHSAALPTDITELWFNVNRDLAHMICQAGFLFSIGVMSGTNTEMTKGGFTNVHQFHIQDNSKFWVDVRGEAIGDVLCTMTDYAGTLIECATDDDRFFLFGDDDSWIKFKVAGIADYSAPPEPVQISMGQLEQEHCRMYHMAATIKSSSHILVDSEYWFVVVTEPEEQVMSGTDVWDTTRSRITSYDNKKWYVKMDGTITTDGHSFFDGCIPTMYNAAKGYYVIFYQLPWELTLVEGHPTIVRKKFLGGRGTRPQHMTFESPKVEIEGKITHEDLLLWAHPINHRIFKYQLKQIYESWGADSMFQFIWNEGYWEVAQIDPPMGFEQQKAVAWATVPSIYRVTVAKVDYS